MAQVCCNASSNALWQVGKNRLFKADPFALMGIVNLTPDSFSDGGKFVDPQIALAHAQSLVAQGAQILDLGAESSRPGAAPLTAEEELQRLTPVLSPLLACDWKDTCHSAPIISVDTYHAKTAQVVLEAGAHCINDISACHFEPELLDIIVQYKPGYVLMHSSARPEIMQEHIAHGNILDIVQKFFEQELHRLTNAGLPETHIMLDVGVGFGKSLEQNLELLHNMHIFSHFGRHILAAVSMKSLFHNALQLDVQDLNARAEATAVATALLGQRGVRFHRVHHVRQCKQALQLTRC